MTLDRFELYELCVQSAPELAGILHAIHGREPRVLGEDFCGTAAVSSAWIQSVPGGHAIAVDHDREPLARVPEHDAIRVVCGDVVRETGEEDSCDVVYVGNFSIGERQTRPDLIEYLRHVRRRLLPGGVFVCDIYGGESALVTGCVDRDLPYPGGGTIRYTWEQRAANPVTGQVENAIHFNVEHGPATTTLADAFVYRWRLWSLPELRDALVDAGFARTAVFGRVPDAVDDTGRVYISPLNGADDLDDDFDVLIAAWTDDGSTSVLSPHQAP